MKYKLFAIAVHIGSIEMGHYVSYSKRGNDDRWHLFNDEQCHLVSEAEALDQEAYLLFYRRMK
jgi:ubiquitin carboxyl-terminal hydrolase 22/27/51